MGYINDSRSCSQGPRCYEQLRVVDDMNESESSVHDFRCYEQLRAMKDMKV